MTLEQEFHQDMISGVAILKKECRYNPTYFLRMVSELGGLGAAKQLLTSKEAQAGLHELCLCGRLDLSMEAMVLDAKYKSLFTDSERAIANNRLKALGYTPVVKSP